MKFLFLFIVCTIGVCRTQYPSQKYQERQEQRMDTIRLLPNQVMQLTPTATIVLKDFSHKKTMADDPNPSPALAYVECTEQEKTTGFYLRKSTMAGGVVHFSSKTWKQFTFQLQELVYDKYIVITVSEENKQ